MANTFSFLMEIVPNRIYQSFCVCGAQIYTFVLQMEDKAEWEVTYFVNNK